MSRSDPHRFDDLFAEFGPVTLRRFFGGEGIYADDVMIAMVFGDRIYFKTDAESRKAYLDERSEAFSFVKKGTGETVVTGWYAVPERLYDDPECFAGWARTARDVALVSPMTMRKRQSSGSRPMRKSR
jgi:DNA transformation protein